MNVHMINVTFIWLWEIVQNIKKIVQSKMKILTAFTHPQAVPNTKDDILHNVDNQTADGSHWVP